MGRSPNVGLVVAAEDQLRSALLSTRSRIDKDDYEPVSCFMMFTMMVNAVINTDRKVTERRTSIFLLFPYIA